MRKRRFGKLDSGDKIAGGCAFMWFAIVALIFIGEIKCVVKAIQCDWDPIGKAEIIYTGATLTGLGAIVGWIDIEDSPKNVENK
jgi:hypothetical protein